jgi:hypothetical protein
MPSSARTRTSPRQVLEELLAGWVGGDREDSVRSCAATRRPGAGCWKRRARVRSSPRAGGRGARGGRAEGRRRRAAAYSRTRARTRASSSWPPSPTSGRRSGRSCSSARSPIPRSR